MIDITQLKVTDALGATRGNVNAAYDEIMAHQPFIGTPVNPSINYYAKGAWDASSFTGIEAKLIATNTASTVKNGLMMLCFPESNGVFVAAVWGDLAALTNPHLAGTASLNQVKYAVVDIPAIKLATQEASISTFVTCTHVGLPSNNSLFSALYGVLSQPVMTNSSMLMFTSSDEHSNAVMPLIEQGDNVCNIIFPYTPIN